MKHMVWSGSSCSNFNKLDSKPETEGQLFEGNIDNEIFTVSGEVDWLIK